MTSFHVEELPPKTRVRLRIKSNRTTIVLNILLISILFKKVLQRLVAIAFFGTPCIQYVNFMPDQHRSPMHLNGENVKIVFEVKKGKTFQESSL